MSFIAPANTTRANPLDVVRAVATENGWALERAGEDGDDELVLFIRGKSTNYKAFFTWMRSLEVFHLACTFDLIMPELRQAELHQLVACINEQLWFGHFDLWTTDATAVFREALLLVGGVTVSAEQCEVMLGTALDICERHYPAFQLVLANGSASEAMDAIMLETNGQA